ncbi:MAG: phosphoribosyltransferase [Phycisphaeraceae bacterium]
MSIDSYRDREHAGEVLGEALRERGYAGRNDVLVLALPRGGVPVAREVARTLHAPLDVMLVRKLGVPGHEELAMGAIASGGARVLNEQVVEQFGITDETVAVVAAREGRELARREQAYRGGRADPAAVGRCVVLVDDGLATGSTMEAAVVAVRQRGPRELVVAVPVAPAETCRRLEQRVDAVVCPLTPADFAGVGQWYERFDQTTDEQVRGILAEAWGEPRHEAERRWA